MDNYLNILEESLRKKMEVLDRIQEYNEKQYQVFTAETVDMTEFDDAIEEKGRLIEELTKLDDGFETLYANIATQLQAEKEKHAGQIRTLQDLIREVTDKSMTVQASEARNKALIEAYFAKEKNQIKENRVSSKVVYGYYKNLNKAILEDNRGFDLRR